MAHLTGQSTYRGHTMDVDQNYCRCGARIGKNESQCRACAKRSQDREAIKRIAKAVSFSATYGADKDTLDKLIKG